MFGATLNVGQRHSRQATISPAWVQSIVPAPPACRYQQHEVWLGLNRYWPTPATLAQHLIDIRSVSVVIAASSIKQYQTSCCFPANTKKWRWFNIVQMLFKCFVFTGLNAAQQTRDVKSLLVRCWANVADGGPALDQHWVNVVFAGSVDKFGTKTKFRLIQIHLQFFVHKKLDSSS